MKHSWCSILVLLCVLPGLLGSSGCAATSKALSPGTELGKADYSRLLETQRQKSEIEARDRDGKGLPAITSAECERRGDLDLEQGSIDTAFIHYDKARRLDPRNMRIRYKMGRLFLRKGLTREARSEFEAILDKDSDSPLGQEGMGRVCFMEGNLDEAETRFHNALEKEPDLWEVHNFLGLISDSRGNHPEAIKHYREALSLEPDTPLSLNNLGLSYYLNGQPEEAAATFEEALRTGSSTEKIYNNYALALGALGDYDKALEVLRQGGNDATAYNNLGVIFMKKGENRRAKEAFETAADLNPVYFVKAQENLEKANEAMDRESVSSVPTNLKLEEALAQPVPVSTAGEERRKGSAKETARSDAGPPEAAAISEKPRTVELERAEPKDSESALPESAPDKVRIEEIRLSNEEGRLAVLVEADGTVASRVYSVGDDRVVIDFPGAETDLTALPPVQPPLSDIRIGRLHQRLWVVLDLENPAEYEVRKQEKQVMVLFRVPKPQTGLDAAEVEPPAGEAEVLEQGSVKGSDPKSKEGTEPPVAAQGDSPFSDALILGARLSVTKAPRYDTSYKKIAFPGGDPGWDRGANTDVVVRAFRHVEIDLQQQVYDDIGGNRGFYGIEKRNTSVDHRRVQTLSIFLGRQSAYLGTGRDADWQPGDIVVWDLEGRGNPGHIGIVSDRTSPGGDLLVVHHRRKVGPFTGYPSEDDVLFAWPVIAHFRWPAPDPIVEPALAYDGADVHIASGTVVDKTTDGKSQ